MDSKKIKLLLAGKWTKKAESLFKYLCNDPLMDTEGVHFASYIPTAEELRLIPADRDVTVVILPNDVSDCETLIEMLKNVGTAKLIGITCNKDIANFCKTIVHSCVTGHSQDSLLCNDDMCEQLRYSIKNARISALAEKAGLHGKWAALPLPYNTESDNVEVHIGNRYDLITIGASAGGTDAIAAVLSRLPGYLPPIMVVQHIPREFVELFAQHLRNKCRMRVCLVTGGECLESGSVYLTAEDMHLTVTKKNGKYYAMCEDGEKMSGHKPSVDKLFFSAANAAGSRAIGVILTGMGSDGAKGLLAMRNNGAYTIGQNEDSCVVYGMPGVAYSIGAVTKQLPLLKISEAIKAVVSDNEGR